MRIEESSIYVNLCKLRKKFYSCQFWMDKSARPIYGTPLMKYCGDTLANFIMSYEIKEDRSLYIHRMFGSWMVMKNDFSFMCEENIIHFPNRKVSSSDPIQKINTTLIDILRLIAKIDEDMGKWIQSRKGKNVSVIKSEDTSTDN